VAVVEVVVQVWVASPCQWVASPCQELLALCFGTIRLSLATASLTQDPDVETSIDFGLDPD
jgi:hypothetical protein